MATKYGRRREVLVGGFLVLGLVLFVLLLFFMGSLESLLSSHAVFEVDFNDVQSLQSGDPVYVFGVKVGKVLGVEMLPPEEDKPAIVRVRIRMPSACRSHIRTGSKVKIDKSLTGNISVLVQGSDGRPLPEGARLEGMPAADFGAVTEKVSQVLEEGEKLVQTISKIAGQIESSGTLPATISEMSELVKDVREEVGPLKDQVRRLLSEVEGIFEENRLDIRHTVANLKETSGLAKGFAEKLGSTPELVDRSLQEIEKAGAAVKGVIVENRAHIDSILADLRQASTSAANLTAEVKRRPWRLLYRPSESEEKAMDLYDAAWAYNLGATELNRSVKDLADQLERAARQGVPLESLKEAEAQVRGSLRKHRQAEETFWEKLRSAE